MECYKLEVAGNTLTYTDAKGSGSRYEILKAIPRISKSSAPPKSKDPVEWPGFFLRAASFH